MKKAINPWIAVAVVVGVIALGFVAYQFIGGSAGGDAYYDKSAENPILPPGVRPGENLPKNDQN